MKNKVGIVTLHGYSNYGNKLQNYALKYVLENIGLEVDTIIIKRKRTVKFTPRKIVQLANSLGTKKINFNKKSLNNQTNNQDNLRTKCFIDFSKEYLSEVEIILNENQSNNQLNDYSYFIAGSDQVWNPSNFNDLDKYFLTFVNHNKRISYGASISVDSIPTLYRPFYKKWLKEMNYISIREEKGAELVYELIDRKVPVHVDPTMLLNKKEWLLIAKKASNRPSEPYILTYFLGGMKGENALEINQLAKEQNFKIINLGDPNEKETYRTGPREFLDYVQNASAFFTDSFHGIVYSIILETPFVAYERKTSGLSMYSRIETLLEKFNMNYREKKNLKTDIFNMDFSGAEEIMINEKKKAVMYLKESLRVGVNGEN